MFYSRRWLSVGLLLAVLAGGLLLGARPISSGAWPWQHPASVHVTGEVSCNDFDLSAETRVPFARVEGFEIRGRSGVLQNAGHGYLASYSVDVPIGWKVEYSVKCSSDHKWHDSTAEQSFVIKKTLIGDSSNQKRNICYGGGIFEPCVPRNLGACVTLVVTGQITAAMSDREGRRDSLQSVRRRKRHFKGRVSWSLKGCASGP